MRDSVYRQWSRPIRQDQLFVLFTDGIFEACNAGGEQFGVDRIRTAVVANLGHDVAALNQSIIEELHTFIKPADPDDDVCLVTIEAASIQAAVRIKEHAVPVGK
jgi:sigma-B regulation protein RsbU (phosphoserine phosphatase)